MNELVLDIRPKSSTSEAIKSIRTNLQFLEVDQKFNSLLITSSMPGDGKSFTAANLAIAFSQIGKKVLIVDADLRLGRQADIFKLKNNAGLSNYLIDQNNTKIDKYIQKTKYELIDVLTNGAIPPNPSELLTSEKNRKLVETLESMYDLVIYDGTPINGLADAVILAEMLDKTLIVTRFKKTKTDDLKNAIKALEKFEHKIAGVVLNRIPSKSHSYYYYYGDSKDKKRR